MTGRRDDSPETVDAVVMDVADFDEEEDIEAAGAARMMENGIVVEAVYNGQFAFVANLC